MYIYIYVYIYIYTYIYIYIHTQPGLIYLYVCIYIYTIITMMILMFIIVVIVIIITIITIMIIWLSSKIYNISKYTITIPGTKKRKKTKQQEICITSCIHSIEQHIHITCPRRPADLSHFGAKGLNDFVQKSIASCIKKTTFFVKTPKHMLTPRFDTM